MQEDSPQLVVFLKPRSVANQASRLEVVPSSQIPTDPFNFKGVKPSSYLYGSKIAVHQTRTDTMNI